MNHEELENIYEVLAALSVRYATLKAATKNDAIKLTDKMAALLGSGKRKRVSVLSVVVEAISNKLFVKTYEVADKALNTTVAAWLKKNSFDRLERQLWNTVIRDGEAYLLVSWDNGGYPKLSLREAFDGTNGAYVFHDPMTGAATYGVNVWSVEDTVYLDMYFPDRVEKYIKKDDEWQKRTDEGDESWPIHLLAKDNTPLGISLLRFGGGVSSIESALQTQQDINEALLDVMATSRNQGWPQRYLKGDKVQDYLTNINGQPIVNPTGIPIRRDLRLEPGSVFLVNGQGADLGQLPSAAVDTALVDKQLEILSLLTSVPTHYFNGNWPSGVALIQAETRLNATVEDWQGELTSPLVALLHYMLRLSNTYTNSSYDEQQEVVIDWYAAQVETEDLKLDRLTKTAQAIAQLETAGAISLESKVRMLAPVLGYDEEQIAAEVTRIQATRIQTQRIA